MNKLQRQALEDVAMLAKALDPEMVDFAYWKRKDEECGTVACLAGWAISFLPSVQKLGLALKKRNEDIQHVQYWELALKEKKLKGYDDFDRGLDALRQAFGIPAEITEEIFGGRDVDAEHDTAFNLKYSANAIKKYLRTH